MENLNLIIDILLFALGCAGAASLGFLHHALQLRVTGALLWVSIIFLLNLIHILIGYYLQSLGLYESIPGLLRAAPALLIAAALYWAVYRSMASLPSVSRLRAGVPTLIVFALQLFRLFLSLLGFERLTSALYVPFIVLISGYIFYVGLVFVRGIDETWNPALQQLVRRLGRFSIVFAPVSALVYTVFYLTGIRESIVISLDFVYLAFWSLIAMSVMGQYLSRLRVYPDKEGLNEDLLSRFGISPREREVLELVREGYTNKEIGEKLFISMTTARTHVSHLLEKTGTSSRVELVTKMSGG
jgi:DNA-binding CsgD family transcriptional regulator